MMGTSRWWKLRIYGSAALHCVPGTRRRGLAVVAVGFVCGIVGLSFVGASPTLAATGGPQWTVTAVSGPTNFAPSEESGEDYYRIIVKNTGGLQSDGSPVTVTDILPEGLTLYHGGVEGFALHSTGQRQELGTPLNCEGLTCVYTGTVIPEETLVVTVPVNVAATPPDSCDKPATAISCVTNMVRVSGGGAVDAVMETPTVISREPASFDFAPGSVTAALSSTQAGAHADLTTSVGFNTVNDSGKLAGAPKETVVDLPPGFAGDLVDTPTCAVALFSLEECPIGTQIGVTTVTLNGSTQVYTEPVYNLTPEPGDVAKLGFKAVVFDVQGDVTVLPGDYGLQTRFQNIKETSAELDSVSLTVWGVPTDPIHDAWRWNPKGFLGEFGVSSDNARVPYLSNPTSCSGRQLGVNILSRSWEAPEQEVHAEPTLEPLGDCDRLGMSSSLSAEPTTQLASAPTGLNFELAVDQTYENPEGLATSELKKSVVTLPEGMTINPSAGAGLGACTPAEFAEEEEEVVESVPGKGCPSDSKIGSVRAQSPAIKEEAVGSLFVAEPYNNPFGSLLALYVVARIPNRGVIVKFAGEVTPDAETGRLVSTFDTANPLQPHGGLPAVPFSMFTLSFRQGATSPLVSPPVCGNEYVVKAELTPWSSPEGVLTDTSAPFEINRGFDGGACPTGGLPPFAPSLSAGTVDNDAASYSPLQVQISRNDGEQEITGFSSQLPPGLTANLSGVQFCSEADIAIAKKKTGAEEEAQPSCPQASQIGHTLVGAGVGSVLAYTPGKIYMAGPFAGSPFSIVAITAAKVGPFDLGTVVVHLPLQINPVTAAVSVGAGSSDQIPHIIDGIVIHVRNIQVYIDRPGFTLNPTNCSPLSLAATVIGSGASFANPFDDIPVTVTNSFQAADCANLAFNPELHGFVSSKTSKAKGAGIAFRLTYPSASAGAEANIAKVKVELPKRLPSRLTTLQKACTDGVFDVNPSACPAASIVGMGTAITPIIPVPLTGPAYFVSHGGAKFPELITVLQGYGITLDLHAETFISKKGVTTGTFPSVPDDPVASFELRFPQGPYSAFAASGNLCKGKLAMPTVFTAQNGAVVNQSIALDVTGCPKRKTKSKAKRQPRKGRHAHKTHRVKKAV